jgi:hypothetical protein
VFASIGIHKSVLDCVVSNHGQSFDRIIEAVRSRPPRFAIALIATGSGRFERAARETRDRY